MPKAPRGQSYVEQIHKQQWRKFSLLLGKWYDKENTCYTVVFRTTEGNTAGPSCVVRIRKSDGQTKRDFVLRVHSDSLTVQWGKTYVLEDSTFAVDYAHWRNLWNSNKFEWSRSPPCLSHAASAHACAAKSTPVPQPVRVPPGLSPASLPPKAHPGMSPREAESVLRVGDAVKAVFYGRWYAALVLRLYKEGEQEMAQVSWSGEETVSCLPRNKVVPLTWC